MKQLKKLINKTWVHLMMACLSLLLIGGCNSDDDGGDDPQPNGSLPKSTTYNFMAVSDPGVIGTAVISENEDGSATVTMILSGLPSSAMAFPSHIHNNSAAETGGIAVDLSAVDPATGISVTQVSQLNDGTPITYAQLIMFDGYINVHDPNDLSILYAQTDIGANALTGESMSYDLMEKDIAGISGTATFNKRKDGSTLLELALTGPVTGDHPAHIHDNSVAETGGVYQTLDTVDASGMSATHIDAGTITYDNLIVYDGYINVHKSVAEIDVIAAQGDIGGNALTGNSETYTLSEVGGSGISGSALFEERTNGNTLVTLMLTGTSSGSLPAHIHTGSVSMPGGIAINLTSVDGTTGMSKTHIESFESGTDVSYSDLLTYDGYINVHEQGNLANVLTQGNIGANAP